VLLGDDDCDFARENEALLASAQPEVGTKPRPVPARVVENGVVSHRAAWDARASPQLLGGCRTFARRTDRCGTWSR
jgi:hypothetical protein